MDSIRNPFAPGAGSQPPELAGRDRVISDVDIALQRILIGRHAKSQILLGLRGTGKTVLLNKIEQMSEERGYYTSYIEAPEGRALAQLIYPKIHQVLRKLSLKEEAKAYAYSAMRTLRSFASTFKITVGDLSISVDPEAGSADSGVLETDLSELFIKIGETAKSIQSGWALLIDEVQYLSKEELSALIVALHRTNQRGLPVIFFGAGLPQVAALLGNAKSYAERLFDFPAISALNDIAACSAIEQPIKEEEEEITSEALKAIVEKTKGYPYFLQEWGYQAWEAADLSPVDVEDIESASPVALKRLDEGFFKVRFDRLTPKEQEYVLAMAELGDGPYRSSDVADILHESAQSLGPRRGQIINKGMIYSPAHGDIDFTVPMFDDYLRRTFPERYRT